MISRVLGGVAIVAVMALTSVGVYLFLGAHQSKLAAAPKKPTQSQNVEHAFILPGSLYLEQSGALYRYYAGEFTQLTREEGWTQPSLFPDGSALLAVKREFAYSDVYSMNLHGVPQQALTNNVAPRYSYDIGDNHWSFYPRLGPDMKTLFMTYDEPKFGYEVDMSIWSMPYPGAQRQARLWTNHSDYTGGDVQPLPLASGGVIYTSYDYGTDVKLTATLVLTTRPGSLGKALTQPDADCSQPALSPDGTQLAMICTGKKQESNIFIATFDGSTLGPLKQVTSGQLVAQPIWAPDGSGIAYLAPSVAGGQFQLWWLARAAYAPPPPSPTPTPSPSPSASPSPSPATHRSPSPSTSPSPSPSPAPVRPVQVTMDLGFDATSPMAWGLGAPPSGTRLSAAPGP